MKSLKSLNLPYPVGPTVRFLIENEKNFDYEKKFSISWILDDSVTKDFETKTENEYIFKQGRYGKSWMGIDGDDDNRYLYWNATEVSVLLFCMPFRSFQIDASSSLSYWQAPL